MIKQNLVIKPFIKWAGGKSQLINDIRAKYPKKIDCYCEPFVGGGAVLLDVLANIKPQKVLINDINTELINTYIQVQQNSDGLIKHLSEFQDEYWGMNDEERKNMYISIREQFNFLKINGNGDVNLEKAVLFIFLNKTCFNGLYRVNKKGLFNVPIGSYKKPPICDSDNLKTISSLLQGVTIRCGDYKECANFIDDKTFVYIDPPYRPLTATASFTAYSENDFNDDEQIRLGQFVDNIHQKGAKVVISNSDPKNADENDHFFDNLYSSYSVQRVSAKRMINSNGNSRGSISELLICNY